MWGGSRWMVTAYLTSLRIATPGEPVLPLSLLRTSGVSVGLPGGAYSVFRPLALAGGCSFTPSRIVPRWPSRRNLGAWSSRLSEPHPRQFSVSCSGGLRPPVAG